MCFSPLDIMTASTIRRAPRCTLSPYTTLFRSRWATTGLPLPDGLVTADQVTDGKPDPEPYLLGARRLGVHPIGALVIEDSVGGLRSGTDAGSRTLAVTSTTPASVLRRSEERRVGKGWRARGSAGRGGGGVSG